MLVNCLEQGLGLGKEGDKSNVNKWKLEQMLSFSTGKKGVRYKSISYSIMLQRHHCVCEASHCKSVPSLTIFPLQRLIAVFSIVILLRITHRFTSMWGASEGEVDKMQMYLRASEMQVQWGFYLFSFKLHLPEDHSWRVEDPPEWGRMKYKKLQVHGGMGRNVRPPLL